MVLPVVVVVVEEGEEEGKEERAARNGSGKRGRVLLPLVEEGSLRKKETAKERERE